jgi:hypothetical protein
MPLTLNVPEAPCWKGGLRLTVVNDVGAPGRPLGPRGTR